MNDRLTIAAQLMAARYTNGGLSIDFWRRAIDVIPDAISHSSTRELYADRNEARRDCAMKIMAREALNLADVLIREEKATA